jgi:hypothetical protein
MGLGQFSTIALVGLSVGAFGLTFGLTPSVEAADVERRVAVLPLIIAGDADTSATTVFDAVARASDLRSRLSVMSIDEYYSHDGAEIAEGASTCGEDNACIAKKLSALSNDLGLMVIINRELDPPLLSMILLEIQTGKVAAEFYGQVGGGPQKISAEIERLASDFFDKLKLPKAGRIIVAVDPPGARVLVPGEVGADRGTTNTFTLPPGTYEIAASLDGYRRATAAAIVKSGETTSLAIRLESENGLLSSPLFWGGVGVAVAAVGVTVIYLVTRSSQACVCVITDDQNECMACQ